MIKTKNQEEDTTTIGFKKLNEEEKINCIKIQAQTLQKSYKKMMLSNKKFVEEGILSRRGIRGGSATKKAANNQLATDWYLKELDYLKIMLNNI